MWLLELDYTKIVKAKSIARAFIFVFIYRYWLAPFGTSLCQRVIILKFTKKNQIN